MYLGSGASAEPGGPSNEFIFMTSFRGEGAGPGCLQRSRAGSSMAEEVRDGGLRGGIWPAAAAADGDTG